MTTTEWNIAKRDDSCREQFVAHVEAGNMEDDDETYYAFSLGFRNGWDAAVRDAYEEESE